MEPWDDSNGVWVPQISLCRGPPDGRYHVWGMDNTTANNGAGNYVYARQGSMLQYSYDGNVGGTWQGKQYPGPVVCDNPTYPGAEHHAPACAA